MRTALYTSHVESGANLVDFHGFELPIWYSSIEEHLATRSVTGMFDVSHMGAIQVCWQGCFRVVNRHRYPGFYEGFKMAHAGTLIFSTKMEI